jgi:hypothetical protein
VRLDQFGVSLFQLLLELLPLRLDDRPRGALLLGEGLIED